MIVRSSSKAAARPAIGRATSSSANAYGLCSSCMSVSHGSRSLRGSQGKPPQKPSQQCSRCSAASILICEDQSFSITTPPSPQHGLLRITRDMTTWFCDAYASWQKGGIENANGRLRRWLPRHLDIDRTSDQDIQEIVLTTNFTPRKWPRVQDAIPSLNCRAWKGCSNLLFLTALRFAPESREPGKNSVRDHVRGPVPRVINNRP
jgi:hypothetical protein